MTRTGLSTVAWLLLAATAPAQAPPTWQWQAGQAYTYKSEHRTAAVEVVGPNKVETSTRLQAIRRWQVLEVDSVGSATLQMTLVALTLETTTPSGDVLRFDSADPEKSTAQLRDQLAQYVGVPLVVLRMDPRGQLLEVKSCKFGSPSRFESELPFVGVLPAQAVRPGLAWDRPYKITLDPPQGTGEQYDAVHHYTCKEVSERFLTLTMATELKSAPAALADRVPLLQKQPEGEWVFDVQNHRLHKASLHTEKELKNHQGEGSSYRIQDHLTEELVGN
jgi:hypothetical protein